MLQTIAPFAGLLGLIGLAGLAGIKHPADKQRPGGLIRLLGLLGLGGLAGFWIDGAGAMGAAGALGLWNHQSPRLAFWGKLGWAWPVGAVFLALHFLG
ncbi:hypothetical protein [Novosphingobium sp.]|uniref:hypothetical protein n=1 Tax=Novosphingobium sp. TaxID=1874826 RepID=UPI0035B07E1F